MTNSTQAPQPTSTIQYAILNPTFQMIQPKNGYTWHEWTGDNITAGLGAAIQSLVSGILIGLGQVLIQVAADKIRVDTVANEKPDLEKQNLKIAAINADCDTLLDSAGNVKEAVLKLLDKTEKEEPNNYPAYISGVAKCKAERMQRKAT